MRSIRTSALGGLVAATAALGLVAAAAPADEVRVGSARTGLLGAELEITNLPVDVPALEVLDAVTYASTDTDATRNALGSPFAQVLVTPLRVGDTAVGAIDVNSRGTGTGTSPAAATDALAPLGANVAPITATASATADSATALVNGAVAELAAVLGAVGVDLDVSGIASNVDASGAMALQGLEVGAIDIDLADLGLDADLLGSLPLGDLLGLLDALPLELPADVQAVVDAILDALAAVDEALAVLDDVVAAVPGDASSVNDLQDDIVALDAVIAAAGPVAALADDVAGVTDLASLATMLAGLNPTEQAILLDCAPGLAVVDILTFDAVLAELVACTAGAASDLAAATTDRDAALAALDELLGAFEDLALVDLPGGLGDLGDILGQLTDAVADLEGLLDVLDGLLDDIAGTSILAVSAFDVGVNAIAGATEADSSATLVCSAVDVAILGETFSAPSCKDGLDEIASALSLVDDALGTVTDLINTLPLGELLEVGDLSVEVFGDLTETVTTEDGYVRALARMELLDLTIPSLTIDPAAFVDSVLGDALDGLAVPDVLAVLGLDDLGLPVDGAPSDTVGGVIDLLGDVDGGLVTDNEALTGAIEDVLAQLDAVVGALDLLELGDLGTLVDAVTTPGLHLVIDPESAAEFAVTAAPAPAPVPSTPAAPAPVTPAAPAAPTPTQPALPATGGGLALLGLLAAGGALSLRRRD